MIIIIITSWTYDCDKVDIFESIEEWSEGLIDFEGFGFLWGIGGERGHWLMGNFGRKLGGMDPRLDQVVVVVYWWLPQHFWFITVH